VAQDDVQWQALELSLLTLRGLLVKSLFIYDTFGYATEKSKLHI
jgi:hypothetical protein